MTDLAEPSSVRLRSIQRWLLLLLFGGVLILLLEIRYAHQAVLGEAWQSWIPLGYLALMCIVIPFGMIAIDRFGSKLLAIAFAGLLIVGCLGFWFHAKGKLQLRFGTVVTTVLSEPGQLLETEDQDTTAPLLAPLSLAGLGAIGILVSILRSREIRSTASFADQNDEENS
jgi:hypothetical protein